MIDYIHTVEKIKVKAGPKLWKAIKSIPVDADISITPEQEADLRDWLYDFLVAFSVSGNDSLAAEFYFREGVNNPTALQHMKKTIENWGIPKGDTPFELFQAMHHTVLDYQGCEYRFGNAFFRHITFRREVTAARRLARSGSLPTSRSSPKSLRSSSDLHSLLLSAGLGSRAGDVVPCRITPNCRIIFCFRLYNPNSGTAYLAL